MASKFESSSSLAVNNFALVPAAGTEAVRPAVTSLPPDPVPLAPLLETAPTVSTTVANGSSPQATGSAIGPSAADSSAIALPNAQPSSINAPSVTSTSPTGPSTQMSAIESTPGSSNLSTESTASSPTSTSTSSTSSAFATTQTSTADSAASSDPPPVSSTPSTSQNTWSPPTSSSASSSTWSEPAHSPVPPPESTWTNANPNTNTWVAAAVAMASSSTSASVQSSISTSEAIASFTNSGEALTGSGLVASVVPTSSRASTTGLVVASSDKPSSPDAARAGAENGEDGATSSTKGGVKGGAVAGVVIALLVVFALGWLWWMKKKRKSVGQDQDPFWSRFFSKHSEDDGLTEKGYDRGDDDALAFGDILSHRSPKKNKSGQGDDGASSFYIPSKSTKMPQPIESQYFGSGDSPLEPPPKITYNANVRSDQSSWLGPPPGMTASAIQPHAQPTGNGQSGLAYAPVAMPTMPSYPATQIDYPFTGGRQSIAPGGYGLEANYSTTTNEVLRDEPQAMNSRAQSGRESLSSYYSSSDADTMGDKKRSLIDSIYSTWGNASSVGGGGRSAVSSAYMPFSDGRASRIPQRKSTLKKSSKTQSRGPSTGPSLERQPSRGKQVQPIENPPAQSVLPRRPMAAMAATPTAVKNNIGFGAEDAPPMPLGWGNHRA